MQIKQQSNGRWVPCESYAALVMALPENTCELLTTSDANSWGYLSFESDEVIPIGYADIGLPPLGTKLGNQIFIGINELLVGYDWPSQTAIFRYKMPTVFHEFVRFDPDALIARDEIGFVSLSYSGDERWVFCVDIIAGYEIDQSSISGKTVEGESFKFVIPSIENNFRN